MIKEFYIEGLPPEHSVGDYIIIIEVVHPNGLSVQTLKFNLKVNNQNQSRLDLLGSKILPVKKGLLLNELKEPGFFAQNSFGEEITSDVRVSFSRRRGRRRKNIISYFTNDLTRKRILLGHHESPFVGFAKQTTDLTPLMYQEHRGTNRAFLLSFISTLNPENLNDNSSNHYHIFSESLNNEHFDAVRSASSPLVAQVYDFEIGQSLMWVTGLGQKQFEGNYINNDKDYFIDCLTLSGDLLWQLDVSVDGQFESNFLLSSNLDEVLFCGYLTGKIEQGLILFLVNNPHGFVLASTRMAMLQAFCPLMLMI